MLKPAYLRIGAFALLLGGCSISPQERTAASLPPSSFVLRQREAEREAERARLRVPGDEHRRLDTLVGDFRAKITYWPKSGVQPEESTGTATHTWILGGRFLACDLRGELGGEPWERHSLLGYDRAREAFVEARVDSSTTEMLPQSLGVWQKEENAITFQRGYEDVVLGTRVRLREVLRLMDWNTHEWELWIEAPAGEDHKALAIRYERNR